MFNLTKIFIPQPVIAQTGWSDRCVDDGIATIQGFECLLANVIQIIVSLAGLAFFIMFIVGGFKFLTSGGDPKKAASAASTLTMAIIGLVGLIISWIILLLIENFTGIPVTQFKIGA
jgi:type IV secretion system pilin